jgi:hypothetical protein
VRRFHCYLGYLWQIEAKDNSERAPRSPESVGDHTVAQSKKMSLHSLHFIERRFYIFHIAKLVFFA